VVLSVFFTDERTNVTNAQVFCKENKSQAFIAHMYISWTRGVDDNWGTWSTKKQTLAFHGLGAFFMEEKSHVVSTRTCCKEH
jgi:hypothetical protein